MAPLTLTEFLFASACFLLIVAIACIATLFYTQKRINLIYSVYNYRIKELKKEHGEALQKQPETEVNLPTDELTAITNYWRRQLRRRREKEAEEEKDWQAERVHGDVSNMFDKFGL
jgi:hypothetical protein